MDDHAALIAFEGEAMVRRTAFATGVLLAALGIGACGGGAPTGQPGASSGSQATAGPGGPGGPVTGDDPCGLLSADEVWAILNSDPLTITRDEVVPYRCYYTTESGYAALVIDYQTTESAAKFAVLEGDTFLEVVDGIGDRAVGHWGNLAFLLGDRLINLNAQWGGNENDLESVLLMGKIITARVTTGTVPPGLIPTPPPVLSAETACDLLSGEEAASVLGAGPVTSTANEFAPQFCTYSLATGEVVISTYLDPKGGFNGWATLATSLTADDVSGIGDKAMFEPSTNILFVLKGDTILNVTVLTSGLSAAEALAQDRQLMEIMLAHL